MHYAIVIDCGSSGTRANFYQWDSNLGLKNYSDLLNSIEAMKDNDTKRPLSKKVTPGLSKLKGESPDETRQYFQGILDYINENFSVDKHKNTGVFILGTAGMRLLDDKTREAIIAQTTRLFQTEYNFVKVKTAVISGADEGMYTWLTANSRLKLFSSGEKMSTAGIIEMGGASVQVTYRVTDDLMRLIRRRLAVSEAQTKFPELIVKPMLTRDKEPYKLVSTTFLGLGGNSAHDAYVDLLISRHLRSVGKTNSKILRKNAFKAFSSSPSSSSRRKSRSKIEPVEDQDSDINDNELGDESPAYTRSKPLEIVDPCLPIDDEPQIVQRPRSMLSALDSGKTIGFQLEPGETNIFTINIMGSSDYNECKQNMDELLYLMKKERMNCENIQEEACSMALLETPFIPFDQTEFIGVGDLHWTNKYLEDSEGLYDQHRIQRKANKICNMTYKEILDKWPKINNEDQSRGKMECFKGVWVFVMLTKGFGLSMDNDNFRTMEKIEGYKLEWTLGAALEKSLVIEMAIASRPEDLTTTTLTSNDTQIVPRP